MNCPVCNTTLKVDSQYDYDIHLEVEYTESCPYCGYSFEYSYGCSGIFFGGYSGYDNDYGDMVNYGNEPTFSWCWTTPDTEVEHIAATAPMVARRMRELLP